jgi:glycosyltransferase involved in cell wall biosynthesis
MKKEEAELELFSKYPKTCFLSNYPPKECGIATFTKNLSTAMNTRYNPKLRSRVIAINDEGSFYNYDKKVVFFEVNKNDIESYINTAKQVNETENIKILCVQHEFGIFGGEYGNYIIPFLETVKKPVVVTFHSVLPDPDEKRLKVVRAIASRCAAIIVMANSAVEILVKDYGIESNKIYVVHHGIPNVPYQDPDVVKKRLKLDGKIVLSTFGLLSRGKGIEYMIKAMQPLVEKYPNLLYLIMGETHPAVRKFEGEKYRNELINLVKKLKLQNHVKFYNKYLPYDEIIEYVSASDIYVVTNLDKNQITSGTLIEAMGYGGKAIVATPSIYAKELLSEGRGVVIKDTENPEHFTEAIDKLLANNDQRKEMGRLAYAFSRQATWSNVALQYLRIFNDVVKLREEVVKKFPKIKLNHLVKLTDEKGVIQFCKHSTPDKSSGYTVDDNARALITAIMQDNLFNSRFSINLAKTYLKFLEDSQDNEGGFKNNHKNEEETTNPRSDDSFGRAIWALGFTTYKSKNQEIKEKAEKILTKSLEYIKKIDSPRAKAFIIYGLSYYYKSSQNPEILSMIVNSADTLINLYKEESSKDWQWFESYLTYSNADLPDSLFLAYEITKNENYLDVAKKTLNFLSNLMFIEGELSPIGQNGWYKRNGERAFFDQQPADASSMIQTYIDAYRITKEKEYYEKSILAFNWFLGRNHLKQMMYDETTGGCFDGLGKHTVNLNQGAESTISYLMSRLILEEVKRELQDN